MFIATSNKGKVFREGVLIGKDADGNPRTFTWDDIPKKVKIVQLQLTYPFKIQLRERPNSPAREFAPLLTIGRYDQYYFSNEATVKMLVQGEKPLGVPETILEAKIVGGIDKKRNLVVETRLDKTGNCTITRFPLKVLKAKIKAGTFRGDILRNGA